MRKATAPASADRLRPIDEWTEDDGGVLWYHWPIRDPPVGRALLRLGSGPPRFNS